MGTTLAGEFSSDVATEMLPVLKSETNKIQKKKKNAGLVHFNPFSGFAYNTLSPTCFFLSKINSH